MLHIKLKEYMENNGINKSAVARGCDITISRMGQFLSGKTRIPAEEFLAICAFMHVSPEAFREDTDE